MSDLICSNCQREIDKTEFRTCSFCNASICEFCAPHHALQEHARIYRCNPNNEVVWVDEDSLELALLRDADNPGSLLLIKNTIEKGTAMSIRLNVDEFGEDEYFAMLSELSYYAKCYVRIAQGIADDSMFEKYDAVARRIELYTQRLNKLTIPKKTAMNIEQEVKRDTATRSTWKVEDGLYCFYINTVCMGHVETIKYDGYEKYRAFFYCVTKNYDSDMIGEYEKLDEAKESVQFEYELFTGRTHLISLDSMNNSILTVLRKHYKLLQEWTDMDGQLRIERAAQILNVGLEFDLTGEEITQ